MEVTIIIMEFINAPNLKKIISLGGLFFLLFIKLFLGLPLQEIISLAF